LGRPWNASITRSANSPGTSSTTTSSPCTFSPRDAATSIVVAGS
jgi:hypothetical protein